jgi:hypothetical protein
LEHWLVLRKGENMLGYSDAQNLRRGCLAAVSTYHNSGVGLNSCRKFPNMACKRLILRSIGSGVKPPLGKEYSLQGACKALASAYKGKLRFQKFSVRFQVATKPFQLKIVFPTTVLLLHVTLCSNPHSGRRGSSPYPDASA